VLLRSWISFLDSIEFSNFCFGFGDIFNSIKTIPIYGKTFPAKCRVGLSITCWNDWRIWFVKGTTDAARSPKSLLV